MAELKENANKLERPNIPKMYTEIGIPISVGHWVWDLGISEEKAAEVVKTLKPVHKIGQSNGEIHDLEQGQVGRPEDEGVTLEQLRATLEGALQPDRQYQSKLVRVEANIRQSFQTGQRLEQAIGRDSAEIAIQSLTLQVAAISIGRADIAQQASIFTRRALFPEPHKNGAVVRQSVVVAR